MKYSLLLTNGRIIDPHNNIDMIGDIGLIGKEIAEIGTDLDSSRAEKVIDVTDKWIIPGVIDPHVHVSSWIGGPRGFKMMAAEGVISALDMAGPPSSVFDTIQKYGSGMNIACLDTFFMDTGGKEDINLSDNQILKKIDNAVEQGALGIKILGGHYPLPPEITRKAIRFASEKGIYVAFHAGTTDHGSQLEGLVEAVELTDGNPVHIAHINSYCRGVVKTPLLEVVDALELLNGALNVWCESYLSAFNGTAGKCVIGKVLSSVTRRCCRMGGFTDDEKGLGESIRAGFTHVVRLQGEENILQTGSDGYDYWKEQKTDITLCFPVNLSEVQFSLAKMKNPKGNFTVDALCTDGGGIPRNTMVRQGLNMLHFGAMTPFDFVKKTSTNAAAMLGFINKGHLSPGADGDITVIDPKQGRAYMGISLGKIIMINGIVVGSSGTVITTEKGMESVKGFGFDVTIVNTREALANKA